MGKLALFFILFVAGLYSLANPWLGITIGYLFSIMGPQYIWWWNFTGIRHFLLLAIPTVAGSFIFIANKKASLHIIYNRLFLLSSVYLFFITLSYFIGPFVQVDNKWRFADPSYVFSNMLKTFIFYYMGLICISDIKKLKYFLTVLPISVIYLTYWANLQYINGAVLYRLAGPCNINGKGIYLDENAFAMLFVTGIPFLFFGGWYFKNNYIRWLLWLIIPFSWHAIFLTASRGGLLGAGVVCVFSAMRSPKKIFGILMIPAFIIAMAWQGGFILKQRAKTIKNYHGESSAETRLQAWRAGIKMILDHPITGVGLASFGPAFPYYSNKHPRQAHNTFIQAAAESGVFAGMAYIGMLVTSIQYALKSKKFFSEKSFLYYFSDATAISLIGFIVCAFFLTLNGMEIQFYLMIIANALNYISRYNSNYCVKT